MGLWRFTQRTTLAPVGLVGQGGLEPQSPGTDHFPGALPLCYWPVKPGAGTPCSFAFGGQVEAQRHSQHDDNSAYYNAPDRFTTHCARIQAQWGSPQQCTLSTWSRTHSILLIWGELKQKRPSAPLTVRLRACKTSQVVQVPR